jgi:hypothetical protein
LLLEQRSITYFEALGHETEIYIEELVPRFRESEANEMDRKCNRRARKQFHIINSIYEIQKESDIKIENVNFHIKQMHFIKFSSLLMKRIFYKKKLIIMELSLETKDK